MKNGILIVFVTAATAAEAAKISEFVVKSRLAACATTFPVVHSMYWWEGKIVNDQESVVMLKTTAANFGGLQDAIRSMHSYETPEIIAVPVTHGLPQYMAWIAAETATNGGK
jgi:periplasmic divalent cation tolerance protein